jgi:hypothetical protein
MNHPSKFIFIAGALLAGTTLTMAPAMAQSLSGRVAVGPIGSTTRTWTSVSDAQRLCQQGCWVTDGIEVTPGNWVPNTLFPGAKSLRDSAGNGLLEIPRATTSPR